MLHGYENHDGLGNRHSILTICSSAVESAPLPGAAQSMEQQIITKEREGLDALKAGNLDVFGSLTADDAVLIDAHGPATKKQVLKNVAEFKLVDYSIDNVNFSRISTKSGLITYRISEKGSSHGKDFSAQAYVSSLWTKRKGRWVCVFSQETAAR